MKAQLQRVDWQLLLFLVLFLNVKLVVKLAAIVIIYLLRFNIKLRINLHSPRLPLFYVSIILIAVLNWLLNGSFMHLNQTAGFFTGLFTWIICLLALHQVKLAIENNSSERIHNTILVFFVLNALVSFLNYAIIVIDSGSLNPFLYQGQFQKYFMGTGDRIRGITFDSSTANALINAFGVIYFLCRKQVIMTLACMAVLLFTASNLTNFLTAVVLVYLFVFHTDRLQKSVVIVCLSFLLIFTAKISPQNNHYTLEVFQKIFKKEKTSSQLPPLISLKQKADSLLSGEEKKQKFAMLYLDSMNEVIWRQRQRAGYSQPAILPTVNSFEPNIHTLPFQRVRDTTAMQEKLMATATQIRADSLLGLFASKKYQLPGKAIAFEQTIRFLQRHPERMLIGAGMGNFSSKLAFRTTALGIAGGYPRQLAYVSHDFRNNHFADYVYFFSHDAQYHSVVNSPNSVYNQLAGEYGIAGLLAFLGLYVGFFLKSSVRGPLTLPLLFVLAGAFFFDYWFEQLSVVIVFELLMLSQTEPKTKKNLNDG